MIVTYKCVTKSLVKKMILRSALIDFYFLSLSFRYKYKISLLW